MSSAIYEARAELIDRATNTINEFSNYRRAHNISWEAIETQCGAMSVLPVRFFPGARFDFCNEPDAHQALAMEVIDYDGETVLDLAAWPIRQPAKVATMFGRAPLVGMPNIGNAATYCFGKPLQLYRTPLAWLQAGGSGCAIVTPALAAHVLNEAPGKIAAQDEVHAKQLGRLLASIVDLTKIVAPAAQARRAS
jgi:hypothetical protein